MQGTIKYFVLDVDGTLTDGGLYYDDNGNETKKFCTKDGTGIIVAKAANIKIIVLTGRECAATTRRMHELGVNLIFQNVKDKVGFLKKWMEENDLDKYDMGYIGDDINDLAPMKLCSYIGCPADSCEEVKKIADYVSVIEGGHGAVRDIIEHYLREKKLWSSIINQVYETGI